MTLPDANDCDPYKKQWLEAGWHYAQLQGEGPSLATVLNRLSRDQRPFALQGATAQSGPMPLSWVRRVAGSWLRTHPDWQHPIEVSTQIWRPEDQVEPTEWRPITGSEAPLRCPEWQILPPSRYHLLICRGTRCNAAGAQQNHEAIKKALRDRKALKDEVLVATTGCLFPCNHAPVVCIYPDNQWRHIPNEAAAAELIRELLGDDELVELGGREDTIPNFKLVIPQ
ncbi:MAG: NADH:ubiquinone oxidoreductase [Propionibacterium sp.]|nr:MAG: NADH:ubiquinone oxidoreductase [Propionibacterium sp.]